jgi:hypothetical protein
MAAERSMGMEFKRVVLFGLSSSTMDPLALDGELHRTEKSPSTCVVVASAA